MAKLPEIQSRGAITRGPQSSVSPAEVANPFQQIANALDAAGEVFQRKEVADAENAGQNAVYRDADGNLKVDLQSNLSQRGRAYNAAAQQGYAARLAGDIRARGTALATESKGNIDTFNSSWKAFRDQTLSAVPREFRGAVTTMLDTEGPRFGLGVSEQKRTSDLKEFEGNIKSEIQLLDDDMAALARAGGVSTDAYKQKQAQLHTLWNQLAENPDFVVGEKEAGIAIQRMESRHLSESMLSSVDRALGTGGIAEARKIQQSILTDEKLALTPAERRQYAGLANERINGFVAQTKANLKPTQDRSKTIQKRLKEGVGLDNDDVDLTAAELARGGDMAGAMELYSSRAMARTLQSFKLSGNEQQVAMAEGALARAKDGASGGETVAPEIIQEFREELSRDLRAAFPAIEEAFAKGIPVSTERVDLLNRQLAIVNDQDLRENFDALFAKNDAVLQASNLSPVELDNLISTLRADVAQGATIAQQQIIIGLEEFQQARTQALRDDPLGYAVSRAIVPPLPALDMTAPDTWAQSFQAYQNGVDVLRARGEVGNISALRPQVQAQVQRALATSTPQESVQLLGSMAQNLSPETYQATLNKIAASGEGKATAAAGALVKENPDAAEGILRGKVLLRENPRLAPSKTDANLSAIEGMLPTTAFAPALEGSRQSLLEAATARYADLSHQSGDTSGELSDERMQLAITEVTGGLVDMNGSPVIAPRYGMTQDDFDKTLSSLSDQDLMGAVTTSGQPVRISDLRNEGRLRAVADGRYILEFGSIEEPTYAIRQQSPGSYGRPLAFVLDLRDR